MQRGFPLDLLRLVRCSLDGGILEVPRGSGEFFVSGRARCVSCGATHPVDDGILSLLAPTTLHPESAREMDARDRKNAAILSRTQPEWVSAIADAIEVEPSLDALALTSDCSILELGCGPGRYTLTLAARAARVVAVDFSRQGLLLLGNRLSPEAQVARVHADVTRPYASPQAFDRALSTLHSNLPDAHHRRSALQQVARALTSQGRAVISMHHLSGRDRLARVLPADRYPENGIFRYYMSRGEARREIAPLFSRLHFVHINAGIPGWRNTSAARLAARVPLVRSALARLFLAVAAGPRRSPGSRVAHLRNLRVTAS